jgi:transcription initiation factor IIF auxiliary subunit
MEFKIDNKTFKKDFKYDEDEEELSITFDTRIDDEDIEDEYEVDIEVFNKDLDDEEVGDEKIEFEVEMIAKEDDLDWYDLEAT